MGKGSNCSGGSRKSQRDRELKKRTLDREVRRAKLDDEMVAVERRMEELKQKKARLWREHEFDERRRQLEQEEEDAKSQSLSSGEEEEEMPMEASASMGKVRKKRKKGKKKDLAAKGEAKNAKVARVDPAESARQSFVELATSTGAAAANAATDWIDGQTVGATQRPSLLELVKLLERQRPQEKYDGLAKTIDFQDHMCRFERAVDLPGLPATWKLAEMNEWFSGLAKVQVSKFMRRVDAEKAFEEAVEKLKQEYGELATTGEEMLEALLEGPKLGAMDAKAINLFVSRLEEIFSLAVETNRNGDFDREPLYKRILTAKLPFLKKEWARHVEENEMRRPKFLDFLEFLSLERKIVKRWVALEDTDKPEKTVGVTALEKMADWPLSTTVEMPSQTEYQEDNNGCKGMEMRRDMVGVQEQGAAVGAQGGSGFGMKGRGPPPCGLCNDWHPLDSCQRFQAMKVDERWSFIKATNRCPLCLKKGHGLDNCYSGARCFCSEQHHVWLHSWRVNEAGESENTA